eukprot:5471540-Alexandrium_andersonii.AAC.1
MRKRAQTAAAAARAHGTAAGTRRHTLKPRRAGAMGRSSAGDDAATASQRGRGRAAGSRGRSGSARGARVARDRAAPRE